MSTMVVCHDETLFEGNGRVLQLSQQTAEQEKGKKEIVEVRSSLRVSFSVKCLFQRKTSKFLRVRLSVLFCLPLSCSLNHLFLLFCRSSLLLQCSANLFASRWLFFRGSYSNRQNLQQQLSKTAQSLIFG